jgi:hypothetical protein
MEKELKHIYGQRRAIKDDVEETRTIEFVISSEKKDRHGTKLMIDRWNLENFNKNGVVGYQHDVYGGGFFTKADPDDLIGVGKAWVEGNDLIGSIKFEPASINEKAEKLFRKVLHGTVTSTSVGFMETKDGEYGTGSEARGAENETYIYGAQELLEFSLVNIPSNTDAVKRNISEDQKAILKDMLAEIEKDKTEKQSVEDKLHFENKNREQQLTLLKLKK